MGGGAIDRPRSISNSEGAKDAETRGEAKEDVRLNRLFSAAFATSALIPMGF